jgi:hypothetical protein
MKPYVARANVDHYLNLLKSNDVSPNDRGVITKLLIAEEDKLGQDLEHLSFAESRLMRGRERANEIRNLLKVFAFGTPQREEAEKLLVNIENVQTLLEDFCHRLRDRVNSHRI